MALYVVQHGLSLSKAEDFQKGLSAEGRLEVQRIAQVAANYKVPVAQIHHSGKTRAAQTARIFGDYLTPQAGIKPVVGINPRDDVAPYAATVELKMNLMVVGHLPFLERLISYLITGQEAKPVLRMQNGGLVCLDHHEQSQSAIIKWAIMPNVP